ncbi:MAG: hypothetical protein JWQ23_1231 [Herminiimonas sp.]|jgi:hypothetical protein|nr:hypothetical protein [Herminiimonas sp.]
MAATLSEARLYTRHLLARLSDDYLPPLCLLPPMIGPEDGRSFWPMSFWQTCRDRSAPVSVSSQQAPGRLACFNIVMVM